ncbi:low-density lipoprotein receptor-related protein 2 [Caerostris extrusa]|uniref:Low-density lipoprotein receptor-related protein 2 n=1 Tax=Caerostris extrusa TaxID=172846 RepID=A0AAV4V5U0_CAEEX|nr:low-density lipoprotein receptor-related protein 2 [Caerostris extrusa]
MGDCLRKGTIYKVSLSGGNQTKFLADAFVGAPYVLAFDWIGRNLFVGNRKASNFEVVKVDGEQDFRRVILSNDGTELGVARPKAMTLDPEAGMLYWLDEGGFGVNAKLGSVQMDGNNSQILLKDGVNYVESLTIDLFNKRLYWSQRSDAVIYSISAEGKDKKPIVSSGISKPIGLTVYNNKLYYLDPIFEVVQRVDLPDGVIL